MVAAGAGVVLDEMMLPFASVTIVVVDPFALEVTLVVSAVLADDEAAPGAGLPALAVG